MKVASLIKEKTGYLVSPDAMFDIQVISLLLKAFTLNVYDIM